MNLPVSPLFVKNYNSTKRHTVNRGGTRSGKTYAILQANIIKWGLQSKGEVIDIVRKTQAELYDSVMKDFFDILNMMEIYDRSCHDKTHFHYRINSNLFRFIGMDKAQKKRGPARSILHINEANGLTLEDWVQLNARTSKQCYYDYNPSEYFWIDENILEKDSSRYELIHSTYLDNYDFLTPDQIAEIENLINIDDFYYKVYVLGEAAIMKGKIYDRYTLIEPEEYDQLFEDEKFYGIDFGYEDYTCLMEVKWCNEKVYERELYYENHKFDEDLLRWMIENNIDYNASIYADPANAAGIKKLRNAGFNIINADKTVWEGIRYCQGLKRFICKSSRNHIKSMNQYKFKQDANGVIREEPVKLNDHTCDAQRYAEFTHLSRQFNPYP